MSTSSHIRVERGRGAAEKLRVCRAALLVLPALITACAQTPQRTMTELKVESLSCTELAQQIEAANKTKLVADQAKSDSWQAVVPVIVAIRYANANSASQEAERQQNLLTARFTQLSCVA